MERGVGCPGLQGVVERHKESLVHLYTKEKSRMTTESLDRLRQFK